MNEQKTTTTESYNHFWPCFVSFDLCSCRTYVLPTHMGNVYSIRQKQYKLSFDLLYILLVVSLGTQSERINVSIRLPFTRANRCKIKPRKTSFSIILNIYTLSLVKSLTITSIVGWQAEHLSKYRLITDYDSVYV